MVPEKKRVGLVLASIHTGISRSVWAGFVRTAIKENISLFVFPGGRLNARQDYENLRNPVYYLANEENLDGCISWSSTIHHNQSKEELEHFHENFEPLPYITLNVKIPGHPCVDFDAYDGMKALVSHCISVHGARKIAFLHGPDYHLSAASRFKGYCDALKEAGLAARNAPVLNPLITDSFNWGDGAAAAAQLFEERSLVPGKDFDTLIGSSDLMALGAINYFAERGYHVPKDFHAAGFNNSEESRMSSCPLSTVHLPYAEQAIESFKILKKHMGRKKNNPIDDVLLHSGLVIRESCGCEEYFKHESDYINDSFMSLIHSFILDDQEKTIPLFEKALIRFFDSGGDTENLARLIGGMEFSDSVSVEKFRRIEPALYRSILKVREQITAHARYAMEQYNTVLNSLKCELLGTRDRNALVQNLARHLPKIGINTAAIVLYVDEKNSICVGSFSPKGISSQKDMLFPARQLVPSGFKPQYADGIFMVQPLFIENQSLGYFVHNTPITDGVILEELRSTVSYALKGIALLEETVRAKRIAEQAEQAKTEFLNTLENGLYNPLQGVIDHIEKLEQKTAAFKLSASAGGELEKEITKLKTFVLKKEMQADSLMDFTLSRIDELTLHKTIFNPGELLPGIGGTFPLMLGDTARLAQCFSLIREQYSAGGSAAAPLAVTAMLTYGGLSIAFRGRTRSSRPDKTRHFSLLLAERIVLMHGGEFTLEQDSCTITLPWTTLNGQEPSKKPVNPQDHVLMLSHNTFLPNDFFALPQIQDVDKAPVGRTAFIVWNASDTNPEEMIKVAGLQRRSEFAGVPFLCYGGKSLIAASSLINAIEHTLNSPKKGVVLFIGSRTRGEGVPEHIIAEVNVPAGTVGGSTVNNGVVREEGGDNIRLEKIHIDSMASFNETVAEIPPSLIVFSALNSADVAIVRRHPITVMVPIIIISESIDNTGDVMAISQYSRLIICHRAASFSPEFRARVSALIAGDEILPPHTGVLVKKAILYFGKNAQSHISRWKLADSINISEDYLTRIFHREMGLALWDYLNRYRIFLAAELLRRTDRTIQDIAYETGFQEQSYFCRVFKKIYGVSPGQLRKKTPELI
jgi:DNA-binding LacI/PurR family transcriptional regulator/AraC-like DNA-binding protein